MFRHLKTIALATLGAALSQPLAAAPTVPLEINTVVPAADEEPSLWQYTILEPAADWMQPGFDDSPWLKGKGGFGTSDTPNPILGTTWNTHDIWLRKTVDIADSADIPLRDLRLWLMHDEDTEVYINGKLALRTEKWNTGYEMFPLQSPGREALKPGKNLIAIHCHQSTGGQFIDAGLVFTAPAKPDKNQWPAERAKQWFGSQALPIGFNYIPANSISYTEMWMDYAFDPELIDRELALAESVGFNCLRVVLPFVVWEAEPEAFKKRFDQLLAISAKHGIKVMPCFFDDCVFGPITDPVFGKQPEVVVGWYANGWTPSPGVKRSRDPETRPALERYVKDIITSHRDDPRIFAWDLYNEPSNSGMGDTAFSLLRDVFRWAREINPAQPVTSGIWGGSQRVTNFLKHHSDIINFHNYQPAPQLRAEIKSLKQLGRPIICSEWLNRPAGSTVEACLTVFIEEGVGAFNWGLVNGKTQTDLPWGHKPGAPYTGIWQHDLFRPDHSPYQPEEIELFKKAVR